LSIEKRRFNGGLASFMSEGQQSPYDSIARSWLALVERRQRNFIELCTTGRWRHYYTRAQLIDEVRKVLYLRAEWARLAGVPVSEQIDLQQIDLQQIDLQQIHLQQTKRPIPAGCRRVRRKAVVARRAWPTALARVGNLGRRSGASLTRWT